MWLIRAGYDAMLGNHFAVLVARGNLKNAIPKTNRPEHNSGCRNRREQPKSVADSHNLCARRQKLPNHNRRKAQDSNQEKGSKE
jgi:hypothetical protein